LICFRLSEEEYNQLCITCTRQGWQNLSTCIRETVLGATRQIEEAPTLTSEVLQHLDHLERQISYQTSLLLDLNSKERSTPAEAGTEQS
jgi:hypothetical protein